MSEPRRDGDDGSRSLEGGGVDEFLPLTPTVYEILVALADRRRHGYGIMLEVEERTGGAMRLRPGSLYRAIHRLQDRGLLEETDGEPEEPASATGDERRRYYRLTDLGRRIVRAEADRLARAVRSARSKDLLGGEEAIR